MRIKELNLLPGQPKVMEYLELHERCQQSDICAAWDLDKSTVSGIVDRMERDGLVQITRSCKDCRKKELLLTSKGKELWNEMKISIQDMERNALNGISSEDEKVFLSVLERIYKNLKEG